MKKQVKISWFTSGTPKSVVIAKNGKSLDNYCISCTTEEDLEDGSYLLDAEFTNYCEFLKEEDILKVLEDYGEEYFKISKVTTSINRVTVVARQITIPHELTLWLDDVRPTNLNGQGASTWLLDKATGTKEINISSDISATNSATYIKKNLYEALHSADNSFVNRWGGEVLRRGYTVYINQHIGINRGFTIRYGKNLTGFECESNIDDLVTRAIGKGYDGIQGDYIDSPLINNYERVYTKEIEYSDVRVNDENYSEGFDTLADAQAELNRRINAEFSENKIDTIKASFNINFAVLSKTEEYKNCALAEKAYIGDTIRVYFKKLNIDIDVRMVYKKYDVLAQKVLETKLSNYIEPKPMAINQIIKRLETVPNAENVLSLAKDAATVLIKSGMKNSYVVVKQNEILIMNTQDINTATKVWRWNNGGLGYSSTGYNGQYGTAITQDGAIVANFITAGVINANLIKSGNILVGGEGQIGNITILNGALTLKNANGEVCIDGSKRTFQIYKYGSGYLHMGANECTKMVTIPHGMNYQPSFHAEFMEYNEEATEERAIHMSPYIKYADTVDSFGHYWLLPSYIAEMYADSTNLYVKMKRSSDASISEGWGIYYRYYIFISYQI